IGVVDTVKINALTETEGNGTIYFSPHQFEPVARSWYLVIRTTSAGDSVPIMNAVREEVYGLDPDLPLYHVSSMQSRIDKTLIQRRAPTFLLISFAGIALGLAAVGVYGVVAFSME